MKRRLIVAKDYGWTCTECGDHIIRGQIIDITDEDPKHYQCDPDTPEVLRGLV